MATPEDLWPAMVQVESKGNPNAVGKAGEIGLVQIKPSTAADYGVPAEALYHPEVQRMLFNRIMGNYLNRYGGNARRAVAAWNAGQGAVDRGATDPGYVGKVEDALGSAASTILGEGTAEAAEFPAGELAREAGPSAGVVPWKSGPLSTEAKEKLGRPMGGVTRAIASPMSRFEEAPRPEYQPSPPIPAPTKFATYAHPMGANITKMAGPPAPPTTVVQNLREKGRRLAAAIPRQILDAASLTEPSRFGRWVDTMTTALAALPPGRYGVAKPQINLPLLRARSEGTWEVPYGDPRSPMWKPQKGEPEMESALKASFEDAAPFLMIAGAPLAIAMIAEGMGASAAIGLTPVATEYLWNGVGIPAVTSALSPMLDKATNHLANGIERTGMVNSQMAFPLADSFMNVFRMFPQLAFFPRDAANVARAMTQRELIPEMGEIASWIAQRTEGPWVKALEKFLSREGYSQKFIPFTLIEALHHEREDQTRAVLERARTQELESARREAQLYRALQEQTERAEVPGEPEPLMETPYGQ